MSDVKQPGSRFKQDFSPSGDVYRVIITPNGKTLLRRFFKGSKCVQEDEISPLIAMNMAMSLLHVAEGALLTEKDPAF